MVLPAPPRDPGWKPNPSGLLALLLVLGVVVGVWWLSGGDPGTPSSTQGVTASDASDASDPVEATDPPVSGEVDSETGLRWVALEELPPEAAETVDLIEAGGPFEEPEDGGVFANREGILPDRPAGSYREYTVPTPGSPDRGARRIVSGPGQLFWTADHYDSFERIFS